MRTAASKVKFPKALLVRMTDDDKVRVENAASKNEKKEGQIVRELIRKYL